MARKRASMREGPLADLFRSTEGSLADQEVRVTAKRNSASRGDVAVAEAQPEVEATRTRAREAEAEVLQPEVEVPQPEPVPEPTPEPMPEPMPEPIPEPTPDPQPEPPDPDPGQPEPVIERHRTGSHEVVERPSPNHEGLEGLMGRGGRAGERPAFGRDEPDMARNTTNTTVPRTHRAVLRVVGVGGAGVNAVNRMIEAEVPGVEFVAINTDLQSLQTSAADTCLQIGADLTRGLGSGSDPRVGYRAAFDEQDRIRSILKGSDMVYIAAGAGGGTGTGAGPVVARLARDVGALTVAAVTKPFSFEGARRAAQAEEGIAALGAEVDTLIVVPNERLLQILERRTSIQDAFRVADDVLRQAVQGISDLVMLPGLINLDFADVRTTMVEAGDAILGIGMGVGEHRAVLAAEKAVSSPLLDCSVEGAQSLLLSITGGGDLSLVEASEAAEIVREAAHPDANIIFGAGIDEDMRDEVWVTVIATRFESAYAHRHRRDRDHRPREPRGGRGPDADPTDKRAAWERRWAGEELYDADRHQDRGRQGDRAVRDLRAESPERDRPPLQPGTGLGGGLVVDAPEFIPGH